MFLRIKETGNENKQLPLKEKFGRMDPLGCIIFTGSVCCLLFALQWGGQTKPWKSATVIGLLVGAVGLAAVFIALQWKLQEKALIAPRVFLKRSIWTGAMVLFFVGASTYLVCPATLKWMVLVF
jgi:multisubunit Na+/H+ antiporter MnhB subunit